MKKTAFLLLSVLAVNLSASAADETVKISGVHLCCKGCVTAAEKAITNKVEGITFSADQEAGTLTLTAADTKKLQDAANALTDGGYFGKSSDERVKLNADSGAKGQKVQSAEIEGVHLCCRQCVTAVDEALKTVPGVKEHTAQRNAKSFTVTGDFNDKEAIAALQKAGLNGKVTK